jgi:hypothetical protein
MTNSEKHLQLVQNQFNELTRLKTLGYFKTSELNAVESQLNILVSEIHLTKSWINKDFLTIKK